jgi:plasmid replication initiation protein
MAMVNPKETLQEEYVFYDSEFMDIIGIENHTTQYIDIPEFLNDIMKNDTFKSIDSYGTFKIIHMFDYVEYNPKDKKIKLAFSNVMLKGLTNLEGNYTKYRLGNILNFKSLYSINLYELFKKELKGNDSKITTIEINKLKDWLGLANKYSRYYDFKNKVLVKAKNEINLLNDIHFTYDEVRKGKKVIAITFNIVSINETEKEIAATSVNVEEKDYIKKVKKMIKDIAGIEISNKSANVIYKCAIEHKKYGNKPLELIMEVAEYSKTQNIKGSFIGWFNTIIISYEAPLKSLKKDAFNDYEQRAYDFDELEKRLLGQ